MKNDYVLIHNLTSYQPGKLNIKFYGTSRIENGISPDDFKDGFETIDTRLALNVQNCGMNSQMTGWGLKMQQLYDAPCNLMVIEVHPGKDPMQHANNLSCKIGRGNYLESALSYYLNRFVVIHHLPNLVSDIRGRLPFKYLHANFNGWSEANYFPDENRINLVKAKVARWAEDDLKRGNYKQGWVEFADLIRKLQRQNFSRLIFLRMPVNGNLKDLNEKILRSFNPMEHLQNEFPNAIFIDASNTPGLVDCITVEDSHLDGVEARTFSRILGQLIARTNMNNKIGQL